MGIADEMTLILGLHARSTVAFIHHLSTSLRRCFSSLLSYNATRFREYILCCMRRTAILKNNSTAEKRREEEAFALKSIAHYCFVETKSNCELMFTKNCCNLHASHSRPCSLLLPKPWRLRNTQWSSTSPWSKRTLLTWVIQLVLCH